MDAFDGAGRDYKPPGYRTILILGLVIIVLIVAVWIAGGAWIAALPQASSAP